MVRLARFGDGMNEKEAREIVKHPCKSDHHDDKYHEAKGYLEAIEKAKVLEDKLNGVLGLLEQDDIEDYEELLISVHDEVAEALNKWEKEK